MTRCPPRRTLRTDVLFCTFLILFSGCKVPAPKSPLVQTVAILLFDNESNNVDAADIMQRFVYLAMKPSAYQVRDRKEVNDFLVNVGIVDGGQLAAVDPVRLGKDLGVQALMFGDVEDFGYTNIGFYVERKVTLSLNLVEVSSGKSLWEGRATGAKRELYFNKDDAQKAFAKGVAEHWIEKLMKLPLEEESKLAVTKALSQLPGFQFCGFAADQETPNALKRGTKGVIKDIIRDK